MEPERVTLRDGTVIVVRPIEPEDRQALAEGFERLSPEARYRRFFSPISRLSERQLDYLTRVDHHDHEALVADDEEGRLVGVARYVRTGPGEAEPAMVVADDWHGRGVAGTLLTRLVQRALDEDIVVFNASVLAGNPEAVHVLRRLGDATVTRQGSEVVVRIDLPEPARPEQPLRTLLKAVAAGTLDPALTFWHRLIPRRDVAVDADQADVVVVALGVEELDDGGPALELARRVAGAASEVVLVAARHPFLDDREDLERRVRRLVTRLGTDGVRARPEVRAGDLGAAALDVATEEHARLIVVTDPPGADAAGRLLGEPWDHISHHAPCSVLVARG
jgi:acetyltransferase